MPLGVAADAGAWCTVFGCVRFPAKPLLECWLLYSTLYTKLGLPMFPERMTESNPLLWRAEMWLVIKTQPVK